MPTYQQTNWLVATRRGRLLTIHCLAWYYGDQAGPFGSHDGGVQERVAFPARIFVFFPSFLSTSPLPSLTAFACCQKVYTVGTPFDFFACVCLYCGFSDTPISPISFPQFPFHYFALWPRTHFPLLPGKPTDSTTPSPHLSIVSDDWTIIIVASRESSTGRPSPALQPPCLSLLSQLAAFSPTLLPPSR